MIGDFFKKLMGQPAEQPLPELDAKLAVIVLLVRLAKSDRHYAIEEIQLIDRLIAGHLDLNPVEAAKLRALGERLEASAPDSDVLRAKVQGEITLDDRKAVMDALWQVGLADRALRPEEQACLTEMAEALGLDTDAAREIEMRYKTGA